MREREVKLLLPAGIELPDLGGAAEGLVAEPAEARRLVTVYWDTPDLRLIRWGCSLRHRAGEGWTVKLPVSRGLEVLARDEHTFAGSPARVPAGARTLLAAYVRGARLSRVLRMVTLRRPVRLLNGDGSLLAELDDDEVSVYTGRRLTTRFREVEVEMAEGCPDAPVSAVVRHLKIHAAAVVDLTPKLVRSLGERARAAPEVTAEALDRRSTAAAVVRRALATATIRLIQHDAGLRLGGDPEYVHQARVATRRLRSDLRTFGPLLDPSWTEELRTELSWLGGELGAVRDAEVLAARLRTRAGSLPAADRPAGERLADVLEASAERARGHLQASLGEARYTALVERLVEAARAPAMVSDGPALEVLPSLVRPAWVRLRRDARRLDAGSPDGDLHRLRIRAKRCRYAAEAVAPVMGGAARRLARRVADLQEVLGEQHDAVIAAGWLRERHDAGSAYVTGELAGLELAAGLAARSAWPAAWRRVRGEVPGWLR